MILRQLYILGGLCAVLCLPACTAQQQIADNSSRYVNKTDSAPSKKSIPNIHKIANAVPKLEPNSKYGNSPSYTVFNKTYNVLPSSKGYKAYGLASWYGNKFHGYRTSNGEIYDMYSMTAAHKTLPLPTYLQVKNLANGKKIIVKVNDRGPFHHNRILDLSYAAAAKLGILKKGTGRVEIIAIDPKKFHQARERRLLPEHPEDEHLPRQQLKVQQTLTLNDKATPPATPTQVTQGKNLTAHYLQMGVFRNKQNAERLIAQIKKIANSQVYMKQLAKNDTKVFKVEIGPITTLGAVEKIKQQLASLHLPKPLLKTAYNN